MDQCRRTTPAASSRPARGFALAATLALLAMLGVASGLWPVADHGIDHAHAPASHADDRACHDDAAPTPASDDTPPLDHDCPTCDLIAGSQTLSLTQSPATLRAVEPAVPALPRCHAPPVCQADLTAWSARPPPHAG